MPRLKDGGQLHMHSPARPRKYNRGLKVPPSPHSPKPPTSPQAWLSHHWDLVPPPCSSRPLFASRVLVTTPSSPDFIPSPESSPVLSSPPISLPNSKLARAPLFKPASACSLPPGRDDQPFSPSSNQ